MPVLSFPHARIPAIPRGRLLGAFLGALAFAAHLQGSDARPAGFPSDHPGPAYANGFPQDPSFFPIGVWLQAPFRAPVYKKMGINTHIGLWEGPTEEQLAELARHGMHAIAFQNETGLTSSHRSVIKAWMHVDEPDNAQKNALGLHIFCIPAREIVARTREMRERDPSRPIFVNFGRAVADTNWHGRGTCRGDTGYYATASQGVDIVSFDIYPVAGSEEPVKGKLEYVARGVANLQRWAKDAQSVWAIIETTRISSETERATPAQIRAQVWLALIQGAKGIGYFVHEFSGGFREDGIFRYPDAVEAVTRINAEIRELAPVLNAPALPDAVRIPVEAPILATAKRHGEALYVFAASTADAPSRPRIELPGLRAGTAEVIGENRTIEIRDGVLEDRFGGYDIHLYRIPR